MRGRDRTPVYQVSGVRSGLTADIRARQRRYAVSMAIRTVCFLGAIVAPSPWRWMLFAGALVLPYIAVVVANGGRESTRDAPPPVALPLRSQLPSGRREERS